MKTFLFSYHWHGERHEIPIQADTKEQAEYRLGVMGQAQYDGEDEIRLPIEEPPPFVIFVFGMMFAVFVNLLLAMVFQH